MLAPDATDDAGHENGIAAAIQGLAWIVEINAIQCGCKVVGVALPADFSIGYDIKPGAFLVLDRESCCIILSQWQVLVINTPELSRASSGREALR